MFSSVHASHTLALFDVAKTKPDQNINQNSTHVTVHYTYDHVYMNMLYDNDSGISYWAREQDVNSKTKIRKERGHSKHANINLIKGKKERRERRTNTQINNTIFHFKLDKYSVTAICCFVQRTFIVWSCLSCLLRMLV